MLVRSPWHWHVSVLLAYTAIAALFVWPLPLHLGTHLTGSPEGDTGVYIWNQWVFHYELAEHHRLPYFTDRIFAFTGLANLSLHNYTIFQNLIALPLIRPFGIIATFNLIYLLLTVLTAYASFLLAHDVTRRIAESWLAGFMFAWSPLLVTRGMGHFSLVAAAPLAVFLLLLARMAREPERERIRDACALGATVWWAASTDAYYAIYCLLLAVVFLTSRVLSVQRSEAAARVRTLRWALDVLILCLAGLIIAMIVGRGWEFTFLDTQVRMRSLYTPMLVLTTLVVLRVWSHFRTSISKGSALEFWRVARLAVRTGVVAGVLLSPVLYAVAVRITDGGLEPTQIYWRSSPRGVDLLALVVPNPNHPLAPDVFAKWLTSRPEGYLENVASLPFVGLAILIGAAVKGWRPSRWWMGIMVSFALLALGPFIYVGGANTYVPGPWALVRYVPLVGMARTPARFAVVMTLAFAVLFATALTWMGRRWPERRKVLLATVSALIFFELLAAPRQLYSAAVPDIYRVVAAEPGDVRVLELPFGVRDGTLSIGNFSSRTQYFQTVHGKPILGGYLSRVMPGRLIETSRNEVLGALITLSEGKPLTPEAEARLVEQGPTFARSTHLGFVVIDRGRVSEASTALAIRAFQLRHVASDGTFELYRPDSAP